jgi:iron complex outermembrane receptor protein
MRSCAYTAAVAAGGLLLLASSANAQAPEPPTPAPPAAGSTQLPPVVVDAPAQKKTAPKKKSAKAKQSAPAAVSSPQPQAPATASGSEGESPFKSPANSFVATTSVAATKTDTPILETPQSISVVTREQLDTRDVKTMVEALQYVPGIYTHPGGKDPRFDTYQIRGFDAQGNAAFRDGLKELGSGDNFTHFKTETYGLERIDVIRGPSSVLYGQIAPGGLVNAITKRPTKEAIREVVGEVGTNDRFQGAFDLSGAVDPTGEFMFRLTGLARDSDAQTAHFSEFIKDDRLFIAPAFTWKPDDNTTFTILTDFQHDDTGNAFVATRFYPTLPLLPSVVVTDVTPTRLFTGDPNYDKFEQDQFRVGYQFEHRFNDALKVRQNLRYGEVDLDYRYLLGGIQANTPVVVRAARAVDEATESFTVDNQIEGKLATGAVKHTVIAGLDYQHFALDSVTFGGPFNLPLNVNNPVYGLNIPKPTTVQASGTQTTEQTGVYAQDQAKLDNWILTLGGRYDWASIDTFNSTPVVSVGAKRQTLSDDEAFTGRAGLMYLFDFGLAPYASYSESFLPTPGTDRNTNPFEPTTGQQYEVGIKYEPLGTRSRFTLAAFDITQQNVLALDPIQAGSCAPSCRTQIGEVRSRGIEAEASASLTEGLELIATYTLMDIEVTKSTPQQRNLGKVPTVTPEEMASIFADYTFHSGPLTGFGLGAGVRYIGETYMDGANTRTNDAYAVVDATLRYDFDTNTRWQLNVSNLFDYEEATCTTAGGCQYVSPQIVTSSVRYRW